MAANQQTQTTNGPSIGFVRATIKIAHPDWTSEQIEAELQIEMQELAKQNGDEDCLFCSA